jgi:O-antigen/teichoic acid export membrane protein
VSSTASGDAPPARSGGLGRNILVLLTSQVTTWVLSTLLLVLVPRWLGPVAVGQLRVSQSLWAIVAVIATFGTSSYLTVEVARDQGRARPLARAVRHVRWVLLAVSLPFVALFVLVAGYERTVVIIITVSAVATFFNLTAMTDRAALFGLEQMSTVARTDVIAEFALATLVIAALGAGGTAVAFALAVAVVAVMTSVLFHRGLVRQAPPGVGSQVHSGLFLLRACAGFLFADAAVTIYLQIDTLVISLIATEQEVGWYATADTIFGSLLFVPAVLMSAVFPRMARIHNDRPEDLAEHVQQAFSTILVVGFWIGLGTVIVSPSLTALLFGPSFQGASPVLAIFGLVCILGYQTILLGQYAIASDRPRFVGIVVLGSAILTIPLDLVLVAWSHDRYGNGAIGAALAYLVTEGLQIAAGLIFLAPHLVSRRSGLRLTRCLIAGAAMLGVCWPLRDRSFVLTGALATVVYFVVLWILRTPDEFERQGMRRGWSAVKQRIAGARNRRSGDGVVAAG